MRRSNPLLAAAFGLFVLFTIPVRLRAQITPPPTKGSGGTPGGPAGGVLSGTYPNPGSTTLAPLASPALTGTPTAPTAAQNANSTQLATTAYTDLAVANAVAGVNPAVAVNAATVQASDTSGLTYNNGVSGIGATFTGTANTALTIDGVTFTAPGQRLLVKNDTQSPAGAFNGIYYVTQLQTGLLPPVLTRALDYDSPSDMNSTGAIPVVSGTVNATTSWLMTANIVTVGATPLTFVQFSYAPSSIGMVKLAQQILGSPAAGVTFASIPGTYTTLRLVITTRSSAAVATTGVSIQFNGDVTAGDYQAVYSLNPGGGTQSNAAIASSGFIGNIPGTTALANAPAQIETVIASYAGTTFLKMARSLGIVFHSATYVATNMDILDVFTTWVNTGAITQIVLTPGSGNFVTGSAFTLYGMA